MKLNAMLLVSAVILATIAGYRSNIIKFDRNFMLEVVPLAGFALALIVVNFCFGRTALVTAGTESSMNTFIKFLPVLVFMFITMGMATVLIGLYKGSLIAFLASGKGIAATWLSALIIPGSMTSLPIVKDLWEQGASKPALISFTLSARLISVWVMIMFVPMLGWRIAMIQYGFATLVSIALSLGAWAWMVVFAPKV